MFTFKIYNKIRLYGVFYLNFMFAESCVYDGRCIAAAMPGGNSHHCDIVITVVDDSPAADNNVTVIFMAHAF